jgi:3-oxoacyl-[acyl-carrier-protein] synthase II
MEALLTALAVRDDFYPPTINYVNPAPECDLDVVPNQGVAAPMRAALSTSFGFGGPHGVLVIRKYAQA